MPRYAKRTNSRKLDPYADKFATWLAIKATKSRNSGAIYGRPTRRVGSSMRTASCWTHWSKPCTTDNRSAPVAVTAGKSPGEQHRLVRAATCSRFQRVAQFAHELLIGTKREQDNGFPYDLPARNVKHEPVAGAHVESGYHLVESFEFDDPAH